MSGRLRSWLRSFVLVLLCGVSVCAAPSAAGAASPPDLAPTAITFDASQVAVDKQIHFDSGIVNNGAATSGVFNIKWLVDNREVGAYGSHAGIPGQTTVLDGNSQFSHTFSQPGDFIVEFRVDVDGHVAESDETNNTRSILVRVPAPAANPNGGFVCVRGPNGGCNGQADPGSPSPASDEEACAAKVGAVAGDPTKVLPALGSAVCVRAFQASVARGGKFLTDSLRQAVCTQPARAIVFGNGANPELERTACPA